ncbi:MAG: 4'-phosphopantetheinyl transferase superfamily protein [Chitinophagaceae bacterium]|nr:MAG: 4'-phosphopantetheinyl transferase superfamily protein [Chitinophagaceae bacterium]
MPLYREWSSDPFSLAAIWKIDEPESFFTERTGVTSTIASEKRRLEHLAGRFLLRHLKEDFPLLSIIPDIHDKPRIPENQYFFSISHSFPYVAAVVSPYVECGIDVQVWHSRMEKLQYKFLSASERILFNSDTKLLSLAWSAKEAAYKWQGRRGVEFSRDLVIKSLKEENGELRLLFDLPLTNPRMEIQVSGRLEPDFSLALVRHTDVLHPTF